MNNKQYPTGMEKERINLAARGLVAKEEIEKKLEEARGLLKKYPDFAKTKTAQAQEDARRFRESVRRFQTKLNDFDEARLSREGKIRNADKAISDAINRLMALKDKGYFFAPDEALLPAKNELKIARDLLDKKDDVPDYPLIIKHAEGAVREAITIQNFWQGQCDLRAGNETKLVGIRLWRETSLPLLENSCQTTLSALKTKTPLDVWEPITKEVGCDEAKIKLDNLIKKAEHLNGMEKQDFATAGVIVGKIQSVKSSIETALGLPGKTLQEFTEAEIKSKSMTAQAAGVISQAERAVSDSDAEGAGRDKLRQAKEKISQEKYLEKSDLPNWFLLAGLLAGAITLAQTAEREAKSRANEVEGVRRRRREEEERRRRDDDYHSSSSWSSGSSSDSSGGGFGGFGGGSFGGGGASGGW